MSVAQTVLPDERRFRGDLESGAYLLGAALRRWRLLRIGWPHALIAVSAAPRPNAPAEFVLRFDLTGYPQAAPTARLWDDATNTELPENRWPAGTRVSCVFRPRAQWPKPCLYLPCDRMSAEGHTDWPQQYAGEIWKPDSTIAHYLNQVSELLMSSDYTGLCHA